MATGTLRQGNATGDVQVEWDKNVAGEVDAARTVFDRLKAKGHMAYRVGEAGRENEQLHSFDPDAQTIVLMPATQGG